VTEKNGDKTFMRITNRDVYDEIRGLHTKIDKIHRLAKETNGKVKLHQKLIFSFGPIIIAIIGWLFVVTLNI